MSIVTVNEPFELSANQLEVIKELAEHSGEPLGEWIRWCVIKTAEMDIELPSHVGSDICKKLKNKWGLLSPYWEDEESGT